MRVLRRQTLKDSSEQGWRKWAICWGRFFITHVIGNGRGIITFI